MKPLEITIPLKISENRAIKFHLEEKNKIRLKINDGGGSSYPVYTGETTVTPKTVEQSLETANKSVLNDITVLQIPYFETSNQKGITVIIGGNG